MARGGISAVVVVGATSKQVLARDVPSEGLPRERATVVNWYSEAAVGRQVKRWISNKTGPNFLRDVDMVSVVPGLITANKEG